MKTAVTVLLLLFVIGCEHSSQPPNPNVTVPSPSADTLPSVGILTGIGPTSDTVHAIDFTWKDSTGKLDSLSEYKGKKVLLNFWATWCPPCREEIPALEDIAAKSGDSIKVIGVSVDGPLNALQTVRNFAKKTGINYPIVLDSNSALFSRYARAYHGSPSIPETYIFSMDGSLKFTLVGSQSEQTFDSLLGRAN